MFSSCSSEIKNVRNKKKKKRKPKDDRAEYFSIKYTNFNNLQILEKIRNTANNEVVGAKYKNSNDVRSRITRRHKHLGHLNNK